MLYYEFLGQAYCAERNNLQIAQIFWEIEPIKFIRKYQGQMQGLGVFGVGTKQKMHPKI